MIKISILYPYSEGKGFDMRYYCEKHIPMVKELLGDVCKGVSVEQGIAGLIPGTVPAYIAMGHIYCDSVEALRPALGAFGPKLKSDISNFTTIEPIMQVSEVKIQDLQTASAL